MFELSEMTILIIRFIDIVFERYFHFMDILAGVQPLQCFELGTPSEG